MLAYFNIKKMLFLNAHRELTLDNPNYKKAVLMYVWGAYLQDILKGDVTVKYFLSHKKRKIQASITAKESGILAGIQEAEWFLKKLKINIVNVKKEGTALKKDEVIMRLEGPADKILSAERTLLNLLQRMSGVATSAKKLQIKLPRSIQLLITRKTLWGLVDKRAAIIGGAGTHRLNLSDAILIKDNHISLEPNWEKRWIKIVKKNPKVRFIEIEIESYEQAEKLISLINDCKKIKNKNLIVMLDNFKPAEIKKTAPLLKKAGFLVEISGGITSGNIKKYILNGVSFISSGAVTGCAHTLDMSLTI